MQLVESLLADRQLGRQLAALGLQVAPGLRDFAQALGHEVHHFAITGDLDLANHRIPGQLLEGEDAHGVHLARLGLQNFGFVLQRRQQIGLLLHGGHGLADLLVVRARQEGLQDLHIQDLAGVGGRESHAHGTFVDPTRQSAKGEARRRHAHGRLRHPRDPGPVGINRDGGDLGGHGLGAIVRDRSGRFTRVDQRAGQKEPSQRLGKFMHATLPFFHALLPQRKLTGFHVIWQMSAYSFPFFCFSFGGRSLLEG